MTYCFLAGVVVEKPSGEKVSMYGFARTWLPVEEHEICFGSRICWKDRIGNIVSAGLVPHRADASPLPHPPALLP